MLFRKIQIIAAVAVCSLFLAGCQTDISGDSYNVNQAGQMNAVGKGVIVSKTPVQVHEDNTGVGAIAGGAAGGIAASGITDNPRGSLVAGVGGALVGGLIGNAVEKKVNTQDAFQYMVKTSKGDEFAVVQGKDPVLYVGQTVTIIYGKHLRLVPYEGN